MSAIIRFILVLITIVVVVVATFQEEWLKAITFLLIGEFWLND